MNTRARAFVVLNACRLKQGLESAAGARAGVRTKTALRVDEERRVGILAERWSKTLLKVAPQFGVRIWRRRQYP
jgi:hypothetical protein